MSPLSRLPLPPSERAPEVPDHEPAPAIVGLVSALVILVPVVGLAVTRPDLGSTDVWLVLGCGALLAAAAGWVTFQASRRRAALQAAGVAATVEAERREARLELILSSLHEGLVVQDRDRRIREYNPAAQRILGIDDRHLGRRPLEEGYWYAIAEDGTRVGVDDLPGTRVLLTGEPVVDRSFGVVRREGVITWLRLTAVPVRDHVGNITGVITTFQDVTEARAAREALRSTEEAATSAAEALTWQQMHDPLTELPNRAQFLDAIRAAVASTTLGPSRTAVLSLDLDRFGHLNDTMGYEVGDEVLLEVADRLRATAGPNVVIARLGGDEFGVLTTVANHTGTVPLAEALRTAISRPLAVGDTTVTLSASIGLAIAVSTDPGLVLRDADTALHKVKARGGDGVELFDSSLRAAAVQRVATEQVLRRALDEDGLRVVYQPIVDLSDGSVAGAEALLRILGPNQELLAPASFIEIAEETGLIVPIGAGVLDDACRQMATWKRTLDSAAPGHIAVNIAARQLNRFLPTLVEGALDRHGLEPSALTLELTETALIEAGHEALKCVSDLHRLGVRLAIDDFGTGYSSLAYLKRFPVDVVKIDRSFTRGLGHQQHDTAIVRAVIALARSLGIEVVAEGVETAEQLAILRDLGCASAQGYLLSRPVEGATLPESFGAIRTTVSRSRSDAVGRPPVLRLVADQ